MDLQQLAAKNKKLETENKQLKIENQKLQNEIAYLMTFIKGGKWDESFNERWAIITADDGGNTPNKRYDANDEW